MEINEVYNQFNRSLLGFIRSRINVKEDAEDILHNVFIRVMQNLDKLSDDEKLTAWIYVIARNAITDYYRKKSNRNFIVVNEIDENTIDDCNYEDNTKGLDACISGLITLLPEEYRQVITDSEINGIRQKELAEKYEMPYSSLRSRVQRGRERLKQLFHNCCHIETDSRGNILDVENKSDCSNACHSCGS